MHHKVSILGVFEITKRKASGEITFKSGKTRNLITDLGLNQLGVTTVAGFNSCVVGSGSATPAITDQWLQSFVARTTSRQGAAAWTFHNNDPVFFARCVTRWQFGEGVAAGNLSEIGMAWGSTTGTLFCRALILDAMGNPTTITVLSDEFLEVTYTHEYYISTADDTGTIELDGESYDYVCRFGGVFNDWEATGSPTANLPNTIRFAGSAGDPIYGASSTALTPIAGAMSAGTLLNASSVVRQPYVSNSFEFKVTATWALGSGNVSGGIKRIVYTPVNAWGAMSAAHSLKFMAQCGFTPPIPKTSTKILTLTFKTSWGRHP